MIFSRLSIQAVDKNDFSSLSNKKIFARLASTALDDYPALPTREPTIKAELTEKCGRVKHEKIKLRHVSCRTGGKEEGKVSAKIPTKECRFGICFHDKMSIIFSYRHGEEDTSTHWQAEHKSDTAESGCETYKICKGRNQ